MAFLICQKQADGCLNEFEAKRSDAKYCKNCGPIVQREQAASWEHEYRPPTGNRKVLTLKCQTDGCPREFKATRGDAKWCDICKAIKRQEKDNHRHNLDREAGMCDCGAKIGRRSEMCRKCAKKAQNQVGENNPNWKGGKTINRGYVMVRNNKEGKVSPYQGEHIIVWEEANGQELPKGWNVHHLNNIHDDNRPENLVAMPPAQHHKAPREAIKPYEERIRQLEEQLQATLWPVPSGNEECLL